VSVGLLVLHMVRPRYVRKVVSAARFFRGLPPARKGQPRLRLASPVRSRPLYFQVPMMVLLLAALYLMNREHEAGEVLGFGVAIAVDTSASMTTRQENETRMASAVAEARRVLAEARDAAGGRPVCFRLVRFDLELVRLAGAADGLEAALSGLEARALGTDLNLVRAYRAALATNQDPECTITHLVTISDMPAPDWVAEESPIRTLWRGVGAPAANAGFTRVHGLRDPLTGAVRRIELTVTARGSSRPERGLRVTGPDGGTVLETPIAWSERGTWTGSFTPERAGGYRLTLSGGDAYALDDSAAITVGGRDGLRVDWRLDDRRTVDLLGWRQETEHPALRVARLPLIDDGVPTIYIAEGEGSPRSSEIRDFFEPSGLLRDLNLDAVEALALRGASLPDGFRPVLRRMDGSVILAERDEPPAVLVPSLPRTGEGNEARFATTTFFNGVRALLGDRPPAPLYELTSPERPEPEGTRLALHPGEGNTARRTRSYGELGSVAPVPIAAETEPIWPMLLAAAALLMTAERLLAAYGGPRWR